METLEDGQIPAISDIPVLVRVQATLQQEVGADQASESPGENLARQSQVLEVSNTLDSSSEEEEVLRSTMATAAEVDNLTDVAELQRLLKMKLQTEAAGGKKRQLYMDSVGKKGGNRGVSNYKPAKTIRPSGHYAPPSGKFSSKIRRSSWTKE